MAATPSLDSRPALTSSPARAVGPDPGVALRGAASLSPSFQPRKQNSHRPPGTRMNQDRPRSSVAHAGSGAEEEARGGKRAEGGPEGATPTAARSVRAPGAGGRPGLSTEPCLRLHVRSGRLSAPFQGRRGKSLFL